MNLLDAANGRMRAWGFVVFPRFTLEAVSYNLLVSLTKIGTSAGALWVSRKVVMASSRILRFFVAMCTHGGVSVIMFKVGRYGWEEVEGPRARLSRNSYRGNIESASRGHPTTVVVLSLLIRWGHDDG
jgi:hypothetical protein